MVNCDLCGGRMREVKATLESPYPYRMSGLKSVLLVGITVRRCRKCGADSPIIPRMGALHQRIAESLLQRESLLRGDELRFLRKLAGFAATRFAALLSVSPSHLSRVENGRHAGFSETTERLARAIVAVTLGRPAVRNVLIRVRSSRAPSSSRRRAVRFQLARSGWRPAA